MKEIIFTDLDGTFLNHHNYSFKESEQARKFLKEKKIPLVFTTSKTRDEVEILQKEVGIKEPFIVENGAAIFFPKNYENVDTLDLEEFNEYKIYIIGQKYEIVLDFYNKVKNKFAMKGYSDMSIEEIAQLTSLSIENAKHSKNRDFCEPFILGDESIVDIIQKEANEHQLKVTKGGRFYHLMGKNQDKGLAVIKAKEIFAKLYNTNIKAIGLGDGYNDIPLLENVEVPILMRNHLDEYINCDIKNLQKSTFKGAKGWNEMVLKNV